MKVRLTKKEIERISGLGWSVKETEDGYVLENWSDGGGDMVIEAKTKQEIIDQCDSYDEEDEFRVWYGANNGEPSNPQHLWNDCLDKGEKYQTLRDALSE